ncbi:MAG: hypothetical protein FIA99_03070 [Ruminiclostridium sp.]|nr:hypothetical protein [Ruminiclostridium sp.]
MLDVTGYTLGEALQMLDAEGNTGIEVKVTTAPGKAGEEYNLQSRVVRQKAVGAIRELVVCNIKLSDR